MFSSLFRAAPGGYGIRSEQHTIGLEKQKGIVAKYSSDAGTSDSASDIGAVALNLPSLNGSITGERAGGAQRALDREDAVTSVTQFPQIEILP
jgi:hypothetical protein